MIKIFKIFENDTELQLLMEYKEGGNLKQSIISRSYTTEEEAKMIMAQLLLTLDYFHKRNIAHRDLKPENVLLHKNS